MNEDANTTTNEAIETETNVTEPNATPPVDESANELIKTQAKLAKLEEQLTDPGYLEYLANKNATKEQNSFDLPDFESMSNKDLVKNVVTMTESRINKTVADIQRKLDSLAAGIGNFVAKTSVENLSNKYRDFGSLQKDIVQLMKEKPGYDIEDLYIIAKNRASARSAGQKPPARAATQAELPKDAQSSTVAKREAKTTTEAALMAWDEVLGADKETL